MHEPSSPPARDGEAPSPRVIATLVENHRRFLAFLERRVGSREAAEDILQEAFVRGLTRGAALTSEESATAWFYRVLRNAIADHWRRRGVERRGAERVAAAEAGATAPAADAELMDEVCRCAAELVETLKPEYADALRRVDLGGATVKAFADTAGITPNNASVRLFRARDALRRQVQRSCGTCADHGCLDCRCGGPDRDRAGAADSAAERRRDPCREGGPASEG